jgi:predicted lactoylglutathione lyase
MTSIAAITLDVPDPGTAEAFYAALGLGDRVRVRAAEAETSGFRGFTLSLVSSQPANVDALIAAAVHLGATVLKPPAKSLWGYGGVVCSPDGAIWKAATSNKKNSGPAAKEFDDLVLLLGVADVKATKQFYVDHGLTVGKSYGSKYVQFESPDDPVKLALYGRKALAKDAGVSPDGTGSHRISIGADAEPFTDPDGFVWEPASG